ncbi:MAG TPA: MurR/RpiR family transcriptional regulator [Lachnoclostridium sp.]|jgi:RpiR family glv operon transcriptional regulator|uniref:MurR/RpiR family transcriptional regulator n=1 Tax=Lacrimispora sp. TaxID=2719234 RepID=UPI000ED780DA|nr:MurR/RpiR family transcriptional regulator [Lacrimispora sp.]HCD44585.1 MurR/RpiR family transcriptional regulator [Lachnoclostridium sp.]
MLIEAINKNYDKLNESDIQSLSIIMSIVYKISEMSIEDLANECNTSKSTILRLTQKLGFSGYSEFKNYLKWENKEHVKDKDKDIKSSVRSDFLNTCQQIESSANLPIIAKEIHKSQNVVVYGTGQAQRHCAMEMQRLFMQMNKYIYYVGASDELCMLSKNLGPDDLVIVISLSGNVQKIKDTLQLLHLKKVKIVSITNLQSNLLAGMSDYSLYAVSSPVLIGEHLYHNSFVNFLTVIEYVFLSYIEVREGYS